MVTGIGINAHGSGSASTLIKVVLMLEAFDTTDSGSTNVLYKNETIASDDDASNTIDKDNAPNIYNMCDSFNVKAFDTFDNSKATRTGHYIGDYFCPDAADQEYIELITRFAKEEASYCNGTITT